MTNHSIKIGRRVSYTSRKNSGEGKITAIEHKRTGTWVTVLDTVRGAFVVVRPSQVGAPA